MFALGRSLSSLGVNRRVVLRGSSAHTFTRSRGRGNGLIGHSSLIPATGEYNGIITPSGSITTNVPIITNNRYIGIFACDSQSYIEALTTRKEGLFAIEGEVTEKGSHIEGYWDAVYVLIAQLITGHDPGEASRKATDRLIDRLGKEWHGEVFAWW